MESWRHVWRDGLLPLLSVSALEALAKGLREDDVRLVQGATTVPPPLPSCQDWPVEAACLIGYCGWIGEGLETVAETEEYFARMCYAVDQAIGDPTSVRWLLNTYDEWPREVMRQELLAEVERGLALATA